MCWLLLEICWKLTFSQKHTMLFMLISETCHFIYIKFVREVWFLEPPSPTPPGSKQNGHNVIVVFPEMVQN